MRCCLMVYLLKMLSDMLQNPSTTFHICPKKVKLGPHQFDSSGTIEFTWHSHWHKSWSVRFHQLGSWSHRDGIANSLFPFLTFWSHRNERSVPPSSQCKLSVSLRNISVQPRWAIGSTKFAMETPYFPFVMFRSHRNERIGPIEFAWPTSG